MHTITSSKVSQSQSPPIVLNPFRTPNQSHHKDVVSTWIENPIFRICYVIAITILLICLMMVGYEAYIQFSQQTTIGTKSVAGPHQFLSSLTTTITTINQAAPTANVVSDSSNVIPEQIVLPEILYKAPLKLAATSSGRNSNIKIRSVADGRLASISSSSSSSIEKLSPPQQLVRQEPNNLLQTNDGTKESKAKREKKPHHHDEEIGEGEEEIEEEELGILTTTDDNVEHMLRPGEVHAKLLGAATKDYLQLELLQDEESGDAFGGGGVVENGSNNENEKFEPLEDLDVVVVLPRKNDEIIVESSPVALKNTSHKNKNHHGDSYNSPPNLQNGEDTVTTKLPPDDIGTQQQQQHLIVGTVGADEAAQKEKEEQEALTVERRRLRHNHVVEIPTPERTVR